MRRRRPGARARRTRCAASARSPARAIDVAAATSLAAGRDRVDRRRSRLLSPIPSAWSSSSTIARRSCCFRSASRRKFGARPRADELRVRIFPDDIAITHHEKELTAGERGRRRGLLASAARAGQRRGRWPPTREAETRAAWHLACLALRRLPRQLDRARRRSRPTGPGPTPIPTALVPPVLDDQAGGLERHAALHRAARSLRRHRSQRGTTIRTVPRRAWSPTTCRWAPIRCRPRASSTRGANGRLEISDDLRWLIDFDRAVAVGMGIRVPLTPQEAAEGFDRIIVLGVRLSHRSPRRSAALLARLLREPPLQPRAVDRAAGRADQQHRGRAVRPARRPPTTSTRPTRSSTTPRRSRSPPSRCGRPTASASPIALGLPIDSVRALAEREADGRRRIGGHAARALGRARSATSSTEMLQRHVPRRRRRPDAALLHRVRPRPRRRPGDPRRRAALRHRRHQQLPAVDVAAVRDRRRRRVLAALCRRGSSTCATTGRASPRRRCRSWASAGATGRCSIRS